MSGSALEVEVRPTSPFRLSANDGGGGAMRVSHGVAARLLHVDERPVLVRAWQPAGDRVVVRAEAVDPEAVAAPCSACPRPSRFAGSEELKLAIERMRFALGVDDDLTEFHRRFRRDPLVGQLIRRMPGFRPKRRPWPWEALVAAIVGQLIEAERAVRIERRIVGRWGLRLGEGRAQLRDVPTPATIGGRAPAEIESMELAPPRAIALRRAAREVAAGHCAISSPAADRRLLGISHVGPWTVRCLGLFGRGELDSLPAGDLAYIKLVGRLAGMDRRATIPEVEEFYAPYEPYRGLVGTLTLAGLYRTVARGRPLRLAA